MSHVGSCLHCPRFLGSDSVAPRHQVMVTVGVTPDDSSSPDTVCMDPGYPKSSSVSLYGQEVASVHPPSVTLHYFIGGESYLYLVRWSVNTIQKTATYGGPEAVRIHPYGCSSMHANWGGLRHRNQRRLEALLCSAVRRLPKHLLTKLHLFEIAISALTPPGYFFVDGQTCSHAFIAFFGAAWWVWHSEGRASRTSALPAPRPQAGLIPFPTSAEIEISAS